MTSYLKQAAHRYGRNTGTTGTLSSSMHATHRLARRTLSTSNGLRQRVLGKREELQNSASSQYAPYGTASQSCKVEADARIYRIVDACGPRLASCGAAHLPPTYVVRTAGQTNTHSQDLNS